MTTDQTTRPSFTGADADAAACSIELILEGASKSVKAAQFIASALPLAGDEREQLEAINRQINDLASQFANLWMNGFPR